MGTAPTIASFFDAWELFQDAVLAGALSGFLLGFLGVYVVLRRLVFLSAAVSQAASLGVTLAFFLQIYTGVPPFLASPTVGAAILTLAAVLPIALHHQGPSVRRDGLLGLGYLVGSAGTLILGTRIAQEVHDIQTILFGSAVAVLPELLHLLIGVTLVVGALHLWWWRGFSAVSFDPSGARVRGLPVRVLEVVLFGSLAISLSASTRVVGALPSFAFSVLPALAAIRVSRNVPIALVLAALAGAAAGALGYLLAFLYELPVGAAQTAVGVLLVGLAELLRALLQASGRGDRPLRP